MGDKTRGLYPEGKFIVSRRDGTDQAGGKHDGCQYFVLDLTHDPHAVPALRSYAAAAREDGYELLANDLERTVGSAASALSSRDAEYGPCGYQYCDWPDGELRCNEHRHVAGRHVLAPPTLAALRERIAQTENSYSLYSGKRGAIRDVLAIIDSIAREVEAHLQPENPGANVKE